MKQSSVPSNGTQWLAKLVSYDTTSDKSNRALIDYVAEVLRGYGIEPQLICDESGAFANLYATIGPADVAGIMLAGHSDVVPVADQAWNTDPFELVEKSGRLHGRGTCDMKGFIALVLARVPQWINLSLHTPVHIAITYDEEVGCLGARRLVDVLQQHPIKPRFCIVGEPTSMRVINAHKGKLSMIARVKGKECHSSLTPEGVNAIEYAAELITHIRKLAVKASKGVQDNSYDVPYTTLHTGTIKGGTALNIVPGHCSFEYEVRGLPQDDPLCWQEEIEVFANKNLVPRMQSIDASTGIEFECSSNYPGMYTPPDSDIVNLARAFTGDNAQASVSFGTEGGLYNGEFGVPTVICGPGSIQQAHKPNEFVAVDQLQSCELFLDRLTEYLCK